MLAAPDSFGHIPRFRSVEYDFALRFKVGSFNGVMRGIAIRAHLGSSPESGQPFCLRHMSCTIPNGPPSPLVGGLLYLCLNFSYLYNIEDSPIDNGVLKRQGTCIWMKLR